VILTAAPTAYWGAPETANDAPLQPGQKAKRLKTQESSTLRRLGSHPAAITPALVNTTNLSRSED